MSFNGVLNISYEPPTWEQTRGGGGGVNEMCNGKFPAILHIISLFLL